MKDVFIGVLLTGIVMFILASGIAETNFRNQAKTGIIYIGNQQYSVVPINLN